MASQHNSTERVSDTAGQGPAPLTVGTLVREFFEETRVPILYIDMDTYLPRLNLPAEVCV